MKIRGKPIGCLNAGNRTSGYRELSCLTTPSHARALPEGLSLDRRRPDIDLPPDEVVSEPDPPLSASERGASSPPPEVESRNLAIPNRNGRCRRRANQIDVDFVTKTVT